MGENASPVQGSRWNRLRGTLLSAKALERVVLVALGFALLATVANITIDNGPRVIARARLDFTVEWSDEPIWLMARDVATGRALYGSLQDLAGFIYGPFLPLLLGLAYGVGLTTLTAMRAVSIGTTLLGAVGAFIVVDHLLAQGPRPVPPSLRRLWAGLGSVLGLCLLSLSITFEALHPDNLAYALVSLGVAMLVPRHPGALRLGIAGALLGLAFVTKQPTVLVSGVVILGSVLFGEDRVRRTAIVASTFVPCAALCLAIGGADGWDWAFLVPSRQAFELGTNKLGSLYIHFTRFEPFLAILQLVGVLLSVVVLCRSSEDRAKKIYSGAVLASVAAGALGYFKERGLWNNLYLPAVIAVPLILAEAVQRTHLLHRAAAVLSLGLLPWATSASAIARQMPARDVQAAVQETNAEAAALCDEGGPITVFWPIYAFRDCPSAQLVPAESFTEVFHAGLATQWDLVKLAVNNGGPVVTHRETPGLLRFGYTESRVVVTRFSWAHRYFPAYLWVYRPPNELARLDVQ